MISFKFFRVFLTASLFAAACRFWQPKTENAPLAAPPSVEENKSGVPFATKEPEIFQTEIHTTATGAEEVIFTARNGANRLTVFDWGKKSEFALLQTAAGNSVLIARNQKIYAENQTANTGAADDVFPTAELLNEKHAAHFEKLPPENNLVKYAVRFEDAPRTEIIMTIDPNINLPVKQEFYSVAGEQKTLLSTTELKNFSLQTDAHNFDLPTDYKKVSPPEFQEILRRERAQ
ncbi:MAG: hypothetical protein M3T96_03860 [Acidobacteriota bacterium]|nr:hypothetical protein [Acidobacteriota bacterium]